MTKNSNSEAINFVNQHRLILKFTILGSVAIKAQKPNFRSPNDIDLGVYDLAFFKYIETQKDQYKEIIYDSNEYEGLLAGKIIFNDASSIDVLFINEKTETVTINNVSYASLNAIIRTKKLMIEKEFGSPKPKLEAIYKHLQDLIFLEAL